MNLPTPKLTSVVPLEDYSLLVDFENGEQRCFDMTPYLDKGVFRELRDRDYFAKVRLIFGGVQWPHEQDLSADTLYLGGVAPLRAEH